MPDGSDFDALYRDCETGLFRFIAARVRDFQSAKDLSQEVYAKAFQHFGSFDPSRSFATWIFSIARNACIDHLRRRVRDPLAGVSQGAPAAAPDLDSLPDRSRADPGVAAERKDLVEAVRKELRRLPDHRRAALEMKVVEGLTYREIADALGAPLGTVAFWVREAIEEVAKRLGERG